MFLLVPAHPGFPGQIPQSRKTVVCVCVSNCSLFRWDFSYIFAPVDKISTDKERRTVPLQ